MSAFAALALVTRQNLILAVSRPHRPRDLGLPGGKLDPGESAANACARELFEETGLVPLATPRLVYTGVDEDSHDVATFVVRVDPRLEPRQMEAGVEVLFVPISMLLSPSCSYRAYNHALFHALGWA